MTKSELEEQLWLLILNEPDIPRPKRQFKFHPDRRWKADFAWPDENLLVEVQGGVWIKGGHTRGKGFIKDRERNNEAQLIGFFVLEVCREHIESGKAIEWIKRFFEEWV